MGYNLGFNYFGNSNIKLIYSLAFEIGEYREGGVYVESYGEFVNFQ